MRIPAIRKNLQIPASIFLLVACNQTTAESTLEAALRACADINEEARRLSCFDDVISRLLPATRLDPAATIAPANSEAEPVISAAPITAETDGDFGKEHWVESGEKVASIESTVERVAKSSQGHLVVTLENGQVWKQRNVKRFHVREGDTVVIERGSFNSFFLKVDDGSRLERFYRIQ